MLSISSAKIIPAIFEFNGSGRLGRERKLHQGGVQQSKLRRGMGRGSKYLPFPHPIPHHPLLLQIKHGWWDKQLQAYNINSPL